MDQARARFKECLHRRYGQSTTPKCYASDLRLFADAVGHKAPEAVTQRYPRVYGETLYEQFRQAMSRLEAIAVEDWPGVESEEQRIEEHFGVLSGSS